MHFDPNLTAIAIVFSVALLCGLLLMRFKQPAIIGYIVAGVILGPSGFQIIEETEAAKTLAELGVLLLLFLIGMELSLRAFKTVYKLASVIVLVQIVFSILVTSFIGIAMSWDWQQGILLGFVLAVSSTAVTVKVLADRGELRTHFGRITVGILIAQDLAVVAMLLVIEALNPNKQFDLWIIPKTIGAIIFVITIVRFLSKRERIRLPLALRQAFGADREVVPIAALAFCGVCATTSGLIGLSTAFGSFLAGLIVGNSSERQIVLRSTRPIQSVLLVVFFLSVGLLIDVGFFFENLGTLIVVFILATIAKGLINIIAVRIAGQPWEQSVLVGVTLGQIGEFAFVIASVGFTVNAIDTEGYKIAVAVIALSLMLGPAWVVLERRLRAAEDLGVKLTAAEIKARDNIQKKLAICVATSPIWGSQLKSKVVETFAAFLVLIQKYLTQIRKK
ncbi:MAG: cation/H(+) antiporter [Rhodospirillaceae bacterium]|nr:cation/H(+) antiporter [Rhodospirillaceae bacterium]